MGGIKGHLENGGLLLSYVAIAGVETIMLDSILAQKWGFVKSFLEIFQNFFHKFFKMGKDRKNGGNGGRITPFSFSYSGIKNQKR